MRLDRNAPLKASDIACPLTPGAKISTQNVITNTRPHETDHSRHHDEKQDVRVYHDLQVQNTIGRDENDLSTEGLTTADGELSKAHSEIERFQVQAREAQLDLEEKFKELAFAKAENQHLRDCLEDCKNRIFQLQAVQHLTDEEIAKRYHDFCAQIEDWVDETLGDAVPFLDGLPAVHRQSSIYPVLRGYLAIHGEWEVFKKHEESIEIVTTIYIVHRHFQEHFLREKIYCPGIPPKFECFFRSMRQIMSKSKTDRGIDIDTGAHGEKILTLTEQDSINGWHSESCRALSRYPDFASGREKLLNSVTEFLTTLFRSAIPENDPKKWNSSKLHALTKEAETLSVDIRTAHGSYFFDYEFVPNVSDNERILFAKDVAKYHIIDVATGQNHLSSASVRQNNIGRVGLKLCTIHPALRKYGKNREVITVEKATVLVRFDHPVVRRGHAKE